MHTWLVPFIYIAAIMAIYLFAPSSRRTGIQRKIRAYPNFYLISDIVLIAISIPATLLYRQVWLDYVAWGLLIVLLGLSIMRIFKADDPVAPATPAEEEPQL